MGSDLIFNPRTITFSDYADGVRVDVQSARPLALEMIHVKPVDADEHEERALAVLLERLDGVEEVIHERNDVAAIRPYLVTYGNCWGAMHDALVAKTRLPASMGDTGDRASKLLARVFPDGIMFIRASAKVAWNHGDRQVRRFVSLDLVAELEEMVGREIVAAVRRSTDELGEVLGVGRTRRESPSRNGLQVALLRYSRALGRYCRLIAAKVDDEDPESAERFRKAVAPIDAYRAAVRARGGESEEPEPEQPEPPIADPTPGDDPQPPTPE